MIDVTRVEDVLLGFVDNGTVATCFWNSTLEAFAYEAQLGSRRRMLEYYHGTGPYIVDNRARVVRYLLEMTDKQWLWMLDNDIRFPRNSLARLLATAEKHECSILGAAYWNKYPGSQTYLSWLNFVQGAGIRAVHALPDDRLTPLPVTAVGMGCTLIHRDVCEAIVADYPNDPWDSFGQDVLIQFSDGGFLVGRSPDDFDQEMLVKRPIDGMQRMGEDVTFPVDPATPVLGADWRWRPIEQLHVGSELLGFDEFSPRYSSRRYRQACVTRLVEKRLPRLRLITDSREIITTTEHPWLARRHAHWPWKWTPAGELVVGRPIASVAPCEPNPDLKSEDYAAGYVQGLLHSDGTFSGKQFIVRMKDTEPLERMSTMLARLGIGSVRGPQHWDGNPKHAPMHRISVNDQVGRAALEPIWETTRMPSTDFAAGYLAGMVDGDGSYHGGHFQIHSVVEARKDRLEQAARMIGVPFTGRGARSVVLHDQESVFRFWQRTLPSLRRRTNPRGQLGNDGVSRTGQEVRHRPETLLAVEKLPLADVLCVETTTGTFIADGLASHNCLRAQKAGFQTFGLPSLVVEHWKPHFVSHGQAAAPLEFDGLDSRGEAVHERSNPQR